MQLNTKKLSGGQSADRLTENERKFVEDFQGEVKNASLAAALPEGTGHRMLARPRVLKAVKRKGQPTYNDLIMGRNERLAFLSAVARDESQSVKDRVKAAEILCKAGGDFIIQVQSETRIEIMVQGFDELIQCRSADPVTGPVIDISPGPYQAPGCEGGTVAGLLCAPDVGDDVDNSAPAPSKGGRPKGSKGKNKSQSNQPVGEGANVL